MAKKKNDKIFLVWAEPERDTLDDAYWEQYETLEDAVSANGDDTEVWAAYPTRLGKFKRKTEIVKEVKKRKKSKRRHD